MSNHHFKNKDLSLKAKGLLSLMLSLPEDWNYNMQGLASLSRDGIDSVRSAIKELEYYGYVGRNMIRNEYGLFTDSLVFVVIISAVFILCMKETEPQKAKKKAKKVITKKGW